MEQLVAFGSDVYFLMLALLLVARSLDFLSTWIGTPNLMLEGNPLAKWLGWRRGIVLNIALCFLCALWPLPSIVLITTSVLVAARNFQYAWLMRSLGEHRYRCWVAERLNETSMPLYLFCLLTQTFVFAAVGGALMFFSRLELVPFAIGMGFITYGVAVALFTLLSLWRLRRTYS
jgi:hypothetical protein